MSEFIDLIGRALSNRFRTVATRERVCEFAQQFLEFALYRSRPLPFYGGTSAPEIVSRTDHIRLRGESVPHLGRYFLVSFGDAAGVDFAAERPAVRAESTARRIRAAESAAGVPIDLARKMGWAATDSSRPAEMQSMAALFLLLIFAPLRFSDIRDVTEIWVTETALRGRSLDRKDKGGLVRSRAAPKSGNFANGL